MPIDDGNGALKLGRRDGGQNSIEQCKHFGVRIIAATKENHRRALGALESKQSWIVEIGGDDNACVTASSGEDFGVRNGREPSGGRMRRLMPATSQMFHCVRRHGHIDQKSHPLNSMTSSSARAAA